MAQIKLWYWYCKERPLSCVPSSPDRPKDSSGTTRECFSINTKEVCSVKCQLHETRCSSVHFQLTLFRAVLPVTSHLDIFQNKLLSWYMTDFWAPSCFITRYFNLRYVLQTSCSSKKIYRRAGSAVLFRKKLLKQASSYSTQKDQLSTTG